MEELFRIEVQKLQNALIKYWVDDNIYLTYRLDQQSERESEAYIYINYGSGDEMIDVEIVADIFLNDDGTIDITYRRMYGPIPDSFTILNSQIDDIDDENIIENYPYDSIRDKIKITKENKILKYSLSNISKELLGYEIRDPRQLTNTLISKFKRCI
ncbi:Hypothetical protein ORPV_717 [Orpheovirus IHUMI-LCC2]|uniref:Uncharacterized protein n=1 Tax=Orpheovirus IHUMI-LCC2 TaxID=2023057 RepID=A0A2I2L531_9VIRU|nr:Hypothetical protein ORPV_717 [Orpheovirus IHUMI-LCC2]SNW62621.1 Hypothetical protein ORPV_717 [Orpheovirus IHUMI-LCC2]